MFAYHTQKNKSKQLCFSVTYPRFQTVSLNTATKNASVYSTLYISLIK